MPPGVARGVRRDTRRRLGLAVIGALALVTADCGDASAPIPGVAAGTGRDGGLASSAGSPETAVPTDPAAYAARLVTATNLARSQAGLPALAESACARDAAAPRAATLAGTAGLEHAPLDDVLTACAPRTVAAENLSRAAAGPERVVDAWMDSFGHRENLLSPTLTDVGVGCVSDGDAMLCSQVFLGP